MLALRARQQRNLLATLILSQGVPMLLGGDEAGRTQGGSNNAWCQDNEISWQDWDGVDADLLDFTRPADRAAPGRAGLPPPRLPHRRERPDSGHPDVVWLRPDGAGDERRGLGREDARALGVFLNGDELERDPDGDAVRGDSFLVLFNAHHEGVEFTIARTLGDALAAGAGHRRGASRGGGRARRRSCPAARCASCAASPPEPARPTRQVHGHPGP